MAYKWDSPQEWLLAKAQEHASNNNSAELLSIINTLVTKMDADSIQDDFQSEMDADGYFEEQDDTPKHDCPSCGETVPGADLELCDDCKA